MKRETNQLKNDHMLNLKQCAIEVCRLILPELVLPSELQVIILTFSGHLFLGKKSISWTVFS